MAPGKEWGTNTRVKKKKKKSMVVIKILRTGFYFILMKGKESSISKIHIKVGRKLEKSGFSFARLRLCIKARSCVYKHSVYTDTHRYKLNLLAKHNSITAICSQLLGIFSNYPSKKTILTHSLSCQGLI